MAPHPWHDEPERHIDDQSLGLSCHIYGQAPVRADGHVNGLPIYFRARHDGWQFTVSLRHDIDAGAIWPTRDEVGFFPSGEHHGYYLSGKHGTTDDASFMRYDDAEQIIRECVRQYLQASMKLGPSGARDYEW